VWTDTALKISEFWGEDPEVLWPECAKAARASVEFRIDSEVAFRMLGSATKAMACSPLDLYELYERDRQVTALAQEHLTKEEATLLYAYLDLDGSPGRRVLIRTADIVGSLKKLRRLQAISALKHHVCVLS
jgi:hypothetical protein